jgi:sugar fermentation stimulation protein A
VHYSGVRRGVFVERPNRFIAHAELDGQPVVCHVKNTGRCRELLTPGAVIYLQESDNPNRKTRYDLIAVEKGGLLINMDAQAPNQVFREWAEGCRFCGPRPPGESPGSTSTGSYPPDGGDLWK